MLNMVRDTEITALLRIAPEQNMARFYAIWLQPDLFGKMSLVCTWGRIGTLGRVRAMAFDVPEAACIARDTILRRKLAKGYCRTGEALT